MATYTIMIVDDEDIICNALEIIVQSQPDMEVVGIANNGVDALSQLENVRPDLILMDVRMPDMDGIECTKQIKERYPDVLILILTTYNEEAYIIDGLAHGASGYILKGPDYAQIIATIRSTLNGQYILPAEVAVKLSNYLMNTKNAKQHARTLPASMIDRYLITQREQDILMLLIERLSVREIAGQLHISEGTIKNYLTTVYEKLNVTNRYEAISLLRNNE